MGTATIRRSTTMRILHTMIRVGDLQRSIDFYTDVMGMRLLRQKDYPDGRFTLALSAIKKKAKGPSWSSPITGIPSNTTWARATVILPLRLMTPTQLATRSKPKVAKLFAKPVQ